MQEQHPIPAPGRGLTIPYKGLAAVVGVLVIAAAIAVPLWQFVFTSSSSKTTAPSIHFHYPKSWTLEPRSAWKGLGAPASASAVLERTKKSGVLVVLRSGAADLSTTGKAAAAASKLNAELKAKYADYKYVKAQTIKLPHAGTSLLFTYARTKQGVLHTITIIPAGKISYVVETASPPANKAIGREIGAILRSATLSSK